MTAREKALEEALRHTRGCSYPEELRHRCEGCRKADAALAVPSKPNEVADCIREIRGDVSDRVLVDRLVAIQGYLRHGTPETLPTKPDATPLLRNEWRDRHTRPGYTALVEAKKRELDEQGIDHEPRVCIHGLKRCVACGQWRAKSRPPDEGER
jgi:hypothetical protein